MNAKQIPLFLAILFTVLFAVSLMLTIAGFVPPDTLVALNTMAGFPFVLCHAIANYGAKRALVLFCRVFSIGLAFERVGAATG